MEYGHVEKSRVPRFCPLNAYWCNADSKQSTCSGDLWITFLITQAQCCGAVDACTQIWFADALHQILSADRQAVCMQSHTKEKKKKSDSVKERKHRR